MKRLLAPVLMLAVLLGANLLQGCAVYKAAVDERNVSTIASDEKITLLIKKEFLNDDSVKYLDYDVASYQGHVYIMGEYESRTQADRAVTLARKVEGVHKVTTYLLPKKKNDTCGTLDSLELEASIKKRLIEDKDVWSTNVDVYMVQCNAVLVGMVGSSAERNRAIAHAKSVPGVRSVQSFLTIL